jgi:hypothetical protein
MEDTKNIDESWKNSVESEKVHIFGQDSEGELAPQEAEGADGDEELNFSNYVASLGFQALIFMGEIPNPVTQQAEKNLAQSKFLIDTLVLLREKTKGNLTEQEGKLLNGSIYELQMKFIEILQKEQGADNKALG